MKQFFLITLCLISLTCFSQEQYTISGYIKDAGNGEALIGASVYVPSLSKGTSSNVYGFYSLTLPGGKYTVHCQYVGYVTKVVEVVLDKDATISFELTEDGIQLNEVVVTGKSANGNFESVNMSTVELNVKSLEKLPAFAGEVDIVKSVQTLPGVSTVGEGASGFNVRGGSVGQNLILLDEAPVYQSSHLFGFFSVFNPDAIKDVKLYKGGIPSQYGGRLSSVLDIRMKEGNNKKYNVTGGLGTVFSRIAVEGPIKKDKSSFIVAARRSYADVFAKAFTDALNDGAALYFYDLTAKTNFNINQKNRIYLSGYFGRDVFRFDKFQGFDWGNRTGTLRWNHVFGNRLFSNYTLFFSNYNYGFKVGESATDNYDWKSDINTYNFKQEYNFFINSKSELSFGAEAILYRFKPATAVTVTDGTITDISLDERKSVEGALYISNDQDISERLSLQYGFRYAHFNYLGGKVYEYGDTIPGMKKPLRSVSQKGEWETIESFGNLEPRASVRYQLSPSSSIKGSYNRMNQYVHLISNTTASTPIDVWIPSTNNVKPQQGDQFTMGYFRNLKKNQFETSVEAYFKKSKNLVEYIDGADLFINRFIESQLLTGIGRSYGVELYVKKNTGKLTGWFSYTVGKTEMKVDGINFGNDRTNRKGSWYPTRFDQRHNLKLVATYDLSKRVALAGNFTYVSGTPTTFPTDRLTVQGYPVPYIKDSHRNNFRIADYHRLDVSVTINNVWRGKKGRKGEDNLVFSIYNLYARRNPFSVYFSQGTNRQPQNQPVTTYAKQLAMIGTLIPSVSYNFKF